MCVTKPGKTDVRILTEGHPKENETLPNCLGVVGSRQTGDT